MRRTGASTVPPYGPVKGMLDGVALVERQTAPVVDVALLKQHGIARANEYKVLHALRFLGLIDADGRTTPESRLLRTRGPARTEALRRLVRRAYADLFSRLDPARASRDDIHNYFVTRHNLSRDLAGKAATFCLELCRLAELDAAADALPDGLPNGEAPARLEAAELPADGLATAPGERADSGAPSRAVLSEPRPMPRVQAVARPQTLGWAVGGDAGPPDVQVTLALTAADIEIRSEAELMELFRRVRRAWTAAGRPEGDDGDERP